MPDAEQRNDSADVESAAHAAARLLSLMLALARPEEVVPELMAETPAPELHQMITEVLTEAREGTPDEQKAAEEVEKQLAQEGPEKFRSELTMLFVSTLKRIGESRQSTKELIKEFLEYAEEQTSLEALGAAFQKLIDPKGARHTPRKRTAPLAPLAKEGYFTTPADRVHKATVEALAPGAIRELKPNVLQLFGVLPGEAWFAAYPFETGKRTGGRNSL